MPQQYLLELNNATVLRSGTPAIDKLTVKIPLGRNTAVLGPNGSGKSTLVKLITRELYPLHNDAEPPIRILGHERWDISELRSQLGIVSRDMEKALEEGDSRSGIEVVLSGFFSTHALYKHTRVTPAMRDEAIRMLDLMEAANFAKKPINQMSTGEARRVLIARALVIDPQSLILDEPTAGLDIVARRRFLERLQAIAQSGKTIIMITHHVEEVIPEVEWIILLKNGRVFAEGPKCEILVAETLSELYEATLYVSQSSGFYSIELNS
ncbi:MAG TPA: ATP-binding cassette domain-containing protein [Fimbriimonadaceae bacterium]|jgi:iron complex transport system ATP-binding protein